MGWNLWWRNCIQNYLQVWKKLSVESKQLNLQGCYKLSALRRKKGKVWYNTSMWLLRGMPFLNFGLRRSKPIHLYYESNSIEYEFSLADSLFQSFRYWQHLRIKQGTGHWERDNLNIIRLISEKFSKQIPHSMFTWLWQKCRFGFFHTWLHYLAVFWVSLYKPSPCPPVSISLLIYRNICPSLKIKPWCGNWKVFL